MLNRAALIISYREPFVQWINEADPAKKKPAITVEQANEDGTVYLISDEDGEAHEEWLALNFDTLFESELSDWYTNRSLWPANRDREMFDEWITVRCHTMIYDTLDEPLIDIVL